MLPIIDRVSLPFKIPIAIILGFLTSFYVFPIEFKFLPGGINTKMMMAALGLATYIINNVTQKRAFFNIDTLLLTISAGFVSLVALIAVFYNNTPDYSYVSYIVTMWVWLGGAYFLIECIKKVYGAATLKILTMYLAVMCCCQCLLALINDSFPVVDNFLDRYVEQGQNYYRNLRYSRLYGLGAALDTAGVRFSAVLIMIAFTLASCKSKLSTGQMTTLSVSFLIITVIGNIVARTTMIGALIGLFYMIYGLIKNSSNHNIKILKRILGVSIFLTIIIAMLTYKYNDVAYEHLRFGFEGFFSMVESGEWHTSSNDHLESMIHFPQNTKTWIIGDGYFAAARLDPYYMGDDPYPMYMGTDIGYLRFIFYFGLIGLFTFSFFFFLCAAACQNKHSDFGPMSWMLLLLNFVIWLKVATDIFVMFALILMCDVDGANDEAEITTDENSLLHTRHL